MVELRNISRRLAKYHNCKMERVKGYLRLRTEDDELLYFYRRSKKYRTRRDVKTYEEFLNAYRNEYVVYATTDINYLNFIKFDSIEELIMKLDLLGV